MLVRTMNAAYGMALQMATIDQISLIVLGPFKEFDVSGQLTGLVWYCGPFAAPQTEFNYTVGGFIVGNLYTICQIVFSSNSKNTHIWPSSSAAASSRLA